MACYNFEKPRVRRVNRGTPAAAARRAAPQRRPARRQTTADVGSPRARGTAAAARASGAGRRRRSARGRARAGRASASDGSGAPGPRCADHRRPLALLLGACASRWRRNSIEARGVRSDAASRQGRRSEQSAGGRGSTPSRAPSTALPVSARAGDCCPAFRAPLPRRARARAPTPCTRPRPRQSPTWRVRKIGDASCARSISCDAPRGRRRSCCASSGSASSRARTALARLRRGGDCRRRHAVVGGALVAANRRWHRRRKMRAVKQWGARMRAAEVRRTAARPRPRPAVLWPWRRRGAQRLAPGAPRPNPPPRRLPRPMSR